MNQTYKESKDFAGMKIQGKKEEIPDDLQT